MRRTLERSQRVEQRQKRWSWGGLSTDAEGRTGTDASFCTSYCGCTKSISSNKGVKMEQFTVSSSFSKKVLSSVSAPKSAIPEEQTGEILTN